MRISIKSSEDSTGILVYLILLILILKAPWNASLSLDETVTAWVGEGDISQVLSRVFDYQATSPLYFLLVHPLVEYLPGREWLLRLPSFLAYLAFLGVIYLTTKRHFSKLGAIASVLACVNPAFVSIAFQARPYALGLLLVSLSLYFFSNWISNKEKPSFIISVLLFILSVYAHYMFAFSFVAHFVLCLSLPYKRSLPALFSFVFMAIPGLSPLLLQLLTILGKLSVYQVAPSPSISSLFDVLFPVETCVILGMSLLLTIINRGLLRFGTVDKTFLVSSLFLWLVAPLVLFSFSLFFGVELWLRRYMLVSYLGFALLLGVLIHALRSIDQKRFFVIIFGSLLLLAQLFRTWMIEDWRGAAYYLNTSDESSTVLVYSGLVENDSALWIENKENWPYLKAPFNYYRLVREAVPVGVHSDLSHVKDLNPKYLAALDIKRPGGNGIWRVGSELLCEQLKNVGKTCAKVWPKDVKVRGLVNIYELK